MNKNIKKAKIGDIDVEELKSDDDKQEEQIKPQQQN